MIIEAVIFMGGLALIIGMILSYISKKFEVKVSEIATKINAVLPQINCGACGYPGCEAYAKAVEKGEKPDKCIPGKEIVKEKIIAILNESKENNSSETKRMSCHQ